MLVAVAAEMAGGREGDEDPEAAANFDSYADAEAAGERRKLQRVREDHQAAALKVRPARPRRAARACV